MNPFDLCKLQFGRSLMQNSLWHWDDYPDLPDLAPHGPARAEGNGQVRFGVSIRRCRVWLRAAEACD